MRRSSIKDIVRAAKRGEPDIIPPVKVQPGSNVKLIPVKNHLLKIQEYDPIGFLAKVMRGEAIDFHHIQQDEDGNLVDRVAYMIPKMSERVEAAKFLSSRLLPTMHAHKIMKEPDEQDDVKDFGKLVERAVVKSSQSH